MGAVVGVGVGVVVAVVGAVVAVDVVVVAGAGWVATCGWVGWLAFGNEIGVTGGKTGGWGVEGVWVFTLVLAVVLAVVLGVVLAVVWTVVAAGWLVLSLPSYFGLSDCSELPFPKLPQKLFQVSIIPSWYCTSSLMRRVLAQYIAHPATTTKNFIV